VAGNINLGIISSELGKVCAVLAQCCTTILGTHSCTSGAGCTLCRAASGNRNALLEYLTKSKVYGNLGAKILGIAGKEMAKR